jgi:hypothetical protein
MTFMPKLVLVCGEFFIVKNYSSSCCPASYFRNQILALSVPGSGDA